MTDVPAATKPPNIAISTTGAGSLAGAVVVFGNYVLGLAPPPDVLISEGSIVTAILGVIIHLVTRPKP